MEKADTGKNMEKIFLALRAYIHNIFIDFLPSFVYDKIAKYGLPAKPIPVLLLNERG